MKKTTNKTKKRKTPHTSTKPKKTALVVTDEYYSLKDMQTVPVSDHFLDMLAQKLYAWIKNKQGYTLEEFCMDHDIYLQTFYRWKERSKSLQEAHKFALNALAAIRERGAITRKLDSGIVASTQAHYSPIWKGLAEWRSKLKQEAEQGSETKVVVIEKFPEEEKEE